MLSHHMRRIFYALLCILGGCATVPDSDLAERYGPVSLDQSITSALSEEFFEEGGWPTEQWWEMFEDPQLNAILTLALKESPTLQSAWALVAKAEQEAKKEKAALFPKLGFDYEEQWQYFSKNGFVRSFYPLPPGSSMAIPPTDNQLDLSLNFNYEIDFFGRNRNLFKAALGRAKAEYAEAKQATLILTTLVVQTYIELQTKLLQQEVLTEQLKERRGLLELIASRHTQGLDPSLPVLEKEESLYTIEKALVQLDKEIVLDRHMLSVLAGASPDTNLAPEPMRALFKGRAALPADLSSDLLARRADLTAQIWRVEAAAKEIGAAKADFYPRVNLMAFAELESLAFNKLFHIGSRQGGLVPAIHLPIFTGGKLTANLKEKVAIFNAETYRYNELLLNAAKEVADSIAILSKTVGTVDIQKKTLTSVQKQYALQLSRCQKGIDNLLPVLEREDHLFIQRYQLLGLERDYLLAILKMIKALGGGYRDR